MQIIKQNNVTGKRSIIKFNALIKELQNFDFINLNRKRVNFILLNNESIEANICSYTRKV